MCGPLMLCLLCGFVQLCRDIRFGERTDDGIEIAVEDVLQRVQRQTDERQYPSDVPVKSRVVKKRTTQ